MSATLEQVQAELDRRKQLKAVQDELARRQSNTAPVEQAPIIQERPSIKERIMSAMQNPDNPIYDFTGPVDRGLEKTGRYAVEGTAEIADIATNPIRLGLQQVPGFEDKFQESTSQGAARLMDEAGIADAQTPAENVTKQGAKFVAGGGGLLAAGKTLAAKSGPIASQVGVQMGQAPATQLAAEGAAGVASEGAKELGGGAATQLIAGLTAGLTPVGAKALTMQAVKLFTKRPSRVDETLLRYDLKGIPLSVVENLRERVDAAYKLGDLDEVQLRRLVDYAKTNTTPTKGSISQDPIQITQERNLAKTGANSNNKNLQQLARTRDDNTTALIAGLDDIAKGSSLDLYKGGEAAIDVVSKHNNVLKTIQSGLYKQARDTDGRTLPLNRSEFINRVDINLRRENLTAFLPSEVKTMLNDISYGQKGSKGETIKVPFNVDSIDQLETILATAQRSTKDGNVKQALSAVKQALIDTDLEAGASRESLKAFRKARSFSQKMYQWQKKSPAIKAIVDGVDPDKFMEDFVIGTGKNASVRNVGKLLSSLKGNKEAIGVVRAQVAAWIKNQATAKNADELGIITQSGLRNALDKIGDRKLELLFGKKDAEQLRRIQRVASYEQAQPSAAAVNNSNTATTGTGLFIDWLDRIGSWVPGWNALVSPQLKTGYAWREGASAVNPDIGIKRPSSRVAPLAAPLAVGTTSLDE